VDVGYDRNMNRKLSFVLFLNDVSEYEGGKLLLYNATEPLIPEALKGTIVFFPSYVLHEVTPVTKGTRNTLVGWVSGPRFK
jgi:PKHD-type hydroxylase